MEGINIKQLEDKIVRVITKIRESRSRPCFQNILTFVNRGGEFNIDMDNLKDVANIMIDKKIIYVRGNEGKESFYIMSDDDIISDDDIDDETINDKGSLRNGRRNGTIHKRHVSQDTFKSNKARSPQSIMYKQRVNSKY